MTSGNLKNNALRFLLQAAQPAHSFREAQHKTGLTRARGLLRPGPRPLAHPRAGARAFGRDNLGPGRLFPFPPGPKEAR
jgi:hypothetical protein